MTLPIWLHRPKGGRTHHTDDVVRQHRLNTVCEEAQCPNRTECWSRKTATFLALGKECTRNCGFCSIDFSKTPKAPEADEPERIALAARDLGLRHVVITMVARDDLPDQGASHIAAILHALHHHLPHATTEVLTSDFSGDLTALDIVLAAQPTVFNHNLETVRSLSPRVRHKALYDRSLSLLAHARAPYVKSGLMLGLGETLPEVEDTLRDLAPHCHIVTIGQYLQPDPRKLRVKTFIPPDTFTHLAAFGRSLGIPHMHCGPFVRSSYNAHLFVK